MKDLWNLVLEASFYGSIVGGVILLTKSILKDKLSGRFNYLIWMLLIIKLIVPFGPKSDVSLFNNISFNQVSNLNIERSTIEYESTFEIENIEKLESTQDRELESNVTNSNLDNNIKNIIPVIWMIGVVNITVVLLFSQYYLYRQIRLNNKQGNARLDGILLTCKEKMTVKRDIKIVVNDFINTPSLVGIISPKILIPTTMISLSDKELEYVCLHELAHYKRKDILFNYTLLIIQAIHWFNPFIWYFFKKVREDMELATDEVVLNLLEDKEHKEYGKAILTVLQKIKTTKFTPGVLGIIEDKNTVKKRIERIKKMKLMKNKKFLFSMVGILSIIILSTVLLTSAKSNDSESESEYINYVKELYNHKSMYIGDSSNVINLINKLPLNEYINGGVELQTSNEPYGLKVFYNFKDVMDNKVQNELYSNSTIIFALIDNLGYIQYVINNDENNSITIMREEIDEYLKGTLTNQAKDLDNFNKLLDYLESSKVNSSNLDIEVSKVLINEQTLSSDGEVLTEGHIILDKEESENNIKVYLIASGGSFGFENGIFTQISGYSTVPMVMNFSKDENGKLEIIEKKEPLDGAYYISSIKDMFPIDLHKTVINEAEIYKEDIDKQQESQAKNYLKTINKDAKVQIDYLK